MLVLGMPFDGSTLEKKSLGGSETAAIYAAKALANEGAKVIVFCNTPDGPMTDNDGVRYLPTAAYVRYARNTPHDINIIQRQSRYFSQRTSAKLNVLWCHDLALGRFSSDFRGTMWNIDK